MANIIELSQFDASVYQIETTDPVLGGPNGIANIQAKQLANRTQYLKQQIDNAIVGHDSLADKLQSIVAADEIIAYGSVSVFPLVGEVARVYIALDTNIFYKWSGTEYVNIASGEGGTVSSEIYTDSSSFPTTGEVGKMYFDLATNSFLKWDDTLQEYVNIAADESGGFQYTLPTASNTVLGGVKIDGTTIIIDGSGVISATGSGTGSPISTLEVSTNFSAVDNNRYIVNTSGGVITGTLPLTPDVGTYIEFIDAGETWETNDLIINGNSELINGLNENFICDVSAMKVEMVFVSSAYGWQVSVVAASSASGTSVAISNDTSTNIERYPTFSESTSGTASTIYTSNTKFKYNPSTGQVEAVAFNSTSDARKKTNVVDLEKGLVTVLNMNPKTFELIETGNEGIGFIAQDLMTVLPEVVSADSEGMLSVNYGVIVAVLVNAIKELKSEIETLKG